MSSLRLSCLFVGIVSLAPRLFAQNDKQVIGDPVLSPFEISEGATVLFLIRFQNVGADTVQHVLVSDTLDPRFDAASFDMVDASHPNDLLRQHGQVRWYFENIQLPPDETGYVMFSVRPQSFLAPGQVIANHATITFDNVLNITTEDTYVWIDQGAEAEPEPEAESDHFSVVPNPNFGNFEVRQSYSNYTQAPLSAWWITDMSGRMVWDGAAQDAAAASMQVMLERPLPGLYLLWVQPPKGAAKAREFTVVR